MGLDYGREGDAITFLMKTQGIRYMEAVLSLARQYEFEDKIELNNSSQRRKSEEDRAAEAEEARRIGEIVTWKHLPFPPFLSPPLFPFERIRPLIGEVQSVKMRIESVEKMAKMHDVLIARGHVST